MIDELRAEVAREISPIAKPREIHVVPELPKTRSGKIMRRLLRDVAEGRELGDTSTLLDPSVFEAIRASKVASQLALRPPRHEAGAGPVSVGDVADDRVRSHRHRRGVQRYELDDQRGTSSTPPMSG